MAYKRRKVNRNLSALILRLIGGLRFLDTGQIDFTRGKHEIFVESKCNSNVWIKMTNRGVGVCGGDNVNMVGYEPTEDGIMFYADIKTDSCEVTWFATRVRRVR
jgi:hypothetical protein